MPSDLVDRVKSYVTFHRFPVLLFISIFIYTTVLSYLSMVRHNLFLTSAWDLGIYEQSIWSTVNGGKFFWYTVELPVNPNGCFFGVHFSPVLFLVLPVYKLFQSTAMLLVLQSFVLALGAVPLYLIGLQETENQEHALFFALLYLIYPPLFGINLFDFHTQAFLPLFFFSAIYYFSNKKFLKYFLFIILALSVIEFVPFIVIFFGLYGLWIGWKEIKHFGKIFNYKVLLNRTVASSILTIFLGIFWYIIARTAIFFFNPTVLPHRNWMELGDPVHNPLGLLWNMVVNPSHTLQLIFSSIGEKITYIFGILAPLGFLSLLDLPSLLIGAPWFLAAFLSTYRPYYTAIGFQYIAFVTPFVFISAVRGSKKILVLKNKLKNSRLNLLRRFNLSVGNIHQKFLACFYVFIIVASYVLVFYQPYITFIMAKLGSDSSQHLTALNRILELVPPDASIMTQNDIFPHLSQRMYAYAMWEWNASSIVGNVSALDFFLENISVDYILIDSSSELYLNNIEKYTLTLIEHEGFGIVSSADYVWLLQKGYNNTQYLFDNGLSIDLYNQGLSLVIYSSSSPEDDRLLSETVWSITVSRGLLEKLGFYKNSELIATWEGYLLIPEDGDYRFYTLSNSSNYRELNIDDVVILNSEDSASKCFLKAGFHRIEFEYILTGNDESLFLYWQPPWEKLPTILDSDFLYQSEKPTVSSIVFSPSFDFMYKSPFPTVNKDYFSANISGYINIEKSGVYTFKAQVDDNTLIYIDGSLVYNSYTSNSANTFEVSLETGVHRICVLYVELEGDASFNLVWQPLGKQTFESIPYSILFWKPP